MIDIFQVFIPKSLDYSKIEEILSSGKLTSGFYLKKFENLLSEFIGNPHVLVTSNNNLAALVALSSIDLKAEDEVIASPMACLASNQPILNFGSKIVWADIDPKTGSLDPRDVEKKISPKTKLILHYHWGGYPGYVDEINLIGKKYGLFVIDDCIESFGSQYKNKIMGNLGTDITTFSFQTVRLPNSIDGGAISFASKELYLKAKYIRDFGIDRITFRDELGEISSNSDVRLNGYNAVMSEFNSYMGYTALLETNKLIEIQRKNAKEWDKKFDNSDFKMLNHRKEINPNYWVYSINANRQMDTLIKMRKLGIYASKIHLRNDIYSCFGGIKKDLIGVKEFSNKQLSLPCGWWVQDIDKLTI